ncbi:MAG: sigma-70 family RNA polymerase sigma factor [Oscillospiraceae bacterium]
MLCEVPLTKEQQAFATDHHGLVYKFLNENHLPEDEFYDVVVFAYLKAVKDYFNSPSAQKFSFSTIATRQMKFRLYDYFRTQERRKRNMEVLSIHVGLYPDGAPLEDTIPAHDPIMQAVGNGPSSPRAGRQSIQAANGYCASETGRLWHP